MKGAKWLSKYDVSFKRTGKLNLTGAIKIGNLADIGSRSSLKELNLSRTSIESISGLKKQPHISTFIADNSKLSTLENFKSISNATSISFKKTPLESLKYVSIALRVVCGNGVKVLNGKQIPESVNAKAATYPKFVGDLIDRGWQFIYPCPDSDSLRSVCNEFGVTYVEEDITKVRDEEKAKQQNEFEASDDDDDEEDEAPAGYNFRDTLYALISQHQDMLDIAKDKFDAACNQYVVDEEDDDFQKALKELLERYSFKFDKSEDIKIQLENAVRSLCMTNEEEDMN